MFKLQLSREQTSQNFFRNGKTGDDTRDKKPTTVTIYKWLHMRWSVWSEDHVRESVSSAYDVGPGTELKESALVARAFTG